MTVSSNRVSASSSQVVKSLYFAFIGVLLLLPFMQFQIFVGIFVNCLLFLSVNLFGKRRTIFLGMIPSLVALVSGLLPLSVAFFPLIIILGNSILIFIFSRYNNIKGMILAALGKFFSIFTAFVLISAFSSLFSLLATIVILQLFTALTGGMLALFLRKKWSYFFK